MAQKKDAIVNGAENALRQLRLFKKARYSRPHQLHERTRINDLIRAISGDLNAYLYYKHVTQNQDFTSQVAQRLQKSCARVREFVHDRNLAPTLIWVG